MALAGPYPRWGMPRTLQLPSPPGTGADSPSARGEGLGTPAAPEPDGSCSPLPPRDAGLSAPPPKNWLVSDLMLFASLQPTWETGR